LAELLKRKFGTWSTMIECSDRRSDDPERRRPDLNRAKEMLNWTPTTSLEDGLAETARYFYAN
jgi:nucleoside-diphosphate-sugar epimerase